MEIQNEILEKGFAIIENVFTETEIEAMLEQIENRENTNNNFKKNNDLFAVRHFFGEFPNLVKLLLNDKLQKLLAEFGQHYNIVKSIYFDKPQKANWVVNWHQDLTISVKNRLETSGFMNWLPKENYFSVQPPIHYLENILTLRIHLDKCSKENGALRVLPESHKKIENIKQLPEAIWKTEEICEVEKGGILLMKPLIWHSSRRSENQQKRRVIHIEFSNLALPNPLIWAELLEVST